MSLLQAKMCRKPLLQAILAGSMWWALLFCLLVCPGGAKGLVPWWKSIQSLLVFFCWNSAQDTLIDHLESFFFKADAGLNAKHTEMDSKLREFVASAAARPSDRARRTNFVRRIEDLTKDALGSDAQILVYGSCFTDTAESNADMDATIYVPMTSRRARSRSSPLGQRKQMLRAVVSRCRQSGLEAFESRHGSGTATIQEAISVHLESQTFRSYPAVSCILSCQRLMPLYSSHLIRAMLRRLLLKSRRSLLELNTITPSPLILV